MRLGERLSAILESLPADWAQARLTLTVTEEAGAQRAALILAPLGPGRSGRAFRFTVSASGTEGPLPETARRVLERLEDEGIDARLTLPGTAAFQVRPAAPERARPGLAESWDELAGRLPADWSDLYVELELASSEDVDRAALLLAPVNPFLHEEERSAFRFRAARRFGYGAAPVMVRRALARLDEARVAGTLRIARIQCGTEPVLTQGPVWREGGRAI